jgi:alkylated DNA repair dioxygenase AlkB
VPYLRLFVKLKYSPFMKGKEHTTHNMETERRLIDFGDGAALQLGVYTHTPSLETLRSAIPWQPSKTVLYGKTHETGRLVATMGAPYAYNGQTTTQCTPMPKPVRDVSDALGSAFGVTFTTCVANLYENGEIGIGAHDDGEKNSSIIVSLSIGASRKMAFHKKDKSETHAFLLKHATVCAMCGDDFQRLWKHSIPKMKCPDARISLTYRLY